GEEGAAPAPGRLRRIADDPSSGDVQGEGSATLITDGPRGDVDWRVPALRRGRIAGARGDGARRGPGLRNRRPAGSQGNHAREQENASAQPPLNHLDRALGQYSSWPFPHRSAWHKGGGPPSAGHDAAVSAGTGLTETASDELAKAAAAITQPSVAKT